MLPGHYPFRNIWLWEVGSFVKLATEMVKRNQNKQKVALLVIVSWPSGHNACATLLSLDLPC